MGMEERVGGGGGRKEHPKYSFSKQCRREPKSEIESSGQNLYNFSTCPVCFLSTMTVLLTEMNGFAFPRTFSQRAFTSSTSNRAG